MKPQQQTPPTSTEYVELFIRLIRFDEWKEKRLANWNPHSLEPPEMFLRNEWFQEIDKQYRELAKALKDMIEVAQRTTKDLIAWDGAEELDSTIDKAKQTLLDAGLTDK